MPRQLKLIDHHVEKQAPPFGTNATDAAVRAWLQAATPHGISWLLAQTERGVVWGRRAADGSWRTSHDAFPKICLADLAALTLQRCRLFGPQSELLLWRVGNGFQARLLLDQKLLEQQPQTPQTEFPNEYFDEPQILWGTQVEAVQDGFSLVSDGVEGLRHAVPLPLTNADFQPIGSPTARLYRPLRLLVRHYLAQDPTDGTLTIAKSRLLDLTLAS